METIVNHNQTKIQSCGNGYLSSLWYSLLELLRSLRSRLILHARPAAVAGRLACLEITGNRRILSGLGLGMVGVYALFFHLLFDESERDYTWYYRNHFYFFFTIRWYITIVCFSGMAFLLSPVKYKSSWIFFALTSAIGVAGVIHYSLYVDSNESFHSMPLWYVLVIAAGAGVGFIKSVDYLCYRKYHLKDGNLARIKGIIKTPGISADQKMEILEKLIAERESFNERI